MKAAFLPKFAGYVEWPAAAAPASGEPLTICMVGNDPFGRLMDGAARGGTAGRTIQVKRVASAAAAGGCNVAFVQGRTAQETSATLAALRARPILTVTDGRSGTARGMIHFVIHQGRVRFHIDEAAAARSGLGLSSRLLGVALSVSRRQ